MKNTFWTCDACFLSLRRSCRNIFQSYSKSSQHTVCWPVDQLTVWIPPWVFNLPKKIDNNSFQELWRLWRMWENEKELWPLCMALWLNCPIMISYQKNQKRELVYEQIHKKKIKDLRKTKKKVWFPFFWAFDRYLQSIKYNSTH